MQRCKLAKELPGHRIWLWFKEALRIVLFKSGRLSSVLMLEHTHRARAVRSAPRLSARARDRYGPLRQDSARRPGDSELELALEPESEPRKSGLVTWPQCP